MWHRVSGQNSFCVIPHILRNLPAWIAPANGICRLCWQLIQPTNVALGKRISVCHVWLDVQHWSTVEQVRAKNVYPPPMYAHNFNSRKSNRIWAVRGARCKKSPFCSIAWSEDKGLPSLSAIKKSNEPNSLASINVSQCLLIVARRIQLNTSVINARVYPWLPRCIVFVNVLSVNDANGSKGNRLGYHAEPTESERKTPPKFDIGSAARLSRPGSPKGIV